jgi:hypothetical protein
MKYFLILFFISDFIKNYPLEFLVKIVNIKFIRSIFIKQTGDQPQQ